MPTSDILENLKQSVLFELAKKYAGTPVSRVFEGFKNPIKR